MNFYGESIIQICIETWESSKTGDKLDCKRRDIIRLNLMLHSILC